MSPAFGQFAGAGGRTDGRRKRAAGMSAKAEAVWTGNHLKMVRFTVENKTLSALNIRESDFWQPGTRAVMFSQPVSQLLAAARMDVYVIRDGEGN
ncbi:hypothetical protein [Escherichia coli]|uniref:hypothetical protein n=1 Tax=Escherichia coli TaxID=562 RepID=UPI0040439907